MIDSAMFDYTLWLAGSTDNAALSLLAATPRLNVLHALYVLSQISCIADLSDAIEKVCVPKKAYDLWSMVLLQAKSCLVSVVLCAE